MYFLGVDTSNYATSLAVCRDSEILLSTRRDLQVKAGELGLRQNDAVFLHNRNLMEMAREITKFLPRGELAAVCVSTSPTTQESSYMPCFLAGHSFASGIAATHAVPLYSTSHQLGHIAAAVYSCERTSLLLSNQDFLAFHVSGGTTELLLCSFSKTQQNATVLASSLDLHAGQCVDRVGGMLGLSFPCGAALSQLALECTEDIAPKPVIRQGNCCLSGLENQVATLLKDGAYGPYAAKFCLVNIASALAEVLRVARRKYPFECIMAGGVSSSSIIRDYFSKSVQNVKFAQPSFSCDNAAGVALIASLKHGSLEL